MTDIPIVYWLGLAAAVLLVGVELWWLARKRVDARRRERMAKAGGAM